MVEAYSIKNINMTSCMLFLRFLRINPDFKIVAMWKLARAVLFSWLLQAH